jgi:hypothetical protein
MDSRMRLPVARLREWMVEVVRRELGSEVQYFGWSVFCSVDVSRVDEFDRKDFIRGWY